MKRKTIGIIVAALMLVLVGGIGWNLRDLPQKRLLNGAESIAFTDVDGTERLLDGAVARHLRYQYACTLL